MRVSRIRVAVGKTINLGNYNSIRIEAEVTVDLDEGETATESMPGIQDELKRLLEDTYRAQKKEQVHE